MTTTDAGEKEIEATARGVIGQLLSGTAGTMFMTKTIGGLLNTAEILEFMGNYFAPTEKMNIDTLLKEWQELKFNEDANPIAIWTALERLDIEFRKCDSSNAFLNTWDRRASSMRSKMPNQPGETWQHYKPTSDDLSDEYTFLTSIRKHYEETALPMLVAHSKSSKGSTLTTVGGGSGGGSSHFGVGGCAECGRTNHTTANHKSKEELLELYQRRKRGRDEEGMGADGEGSAASTASSKKMDTKKISFKGKCHFCLEPGHRMRECPMMAEFRQQRKTSK